jgi:hypothetical protein
MDNLDMNPAKIITCFAVMLFLAACMPKANWAVPATIASPTASPQIENRLPYQDKFSDNRSVWPTGKWDDDWKQGSATVGPSSYVIKVEAKRALASQIYPENSPILMTVEGFAVSLDTKIDQVTDTQGLGIAITDAEGIGNSANQFIFVVSGQEYYFASRINQVGKRIIGRTRSDAINKDGQNKLGMQLKGDSIVLSMNDEVLTTIDVPDLVKITRIRFGIVYLQDSVGRVTRFEFDNYDIRTLK